jgi:hypothetical protein
MKHSKDKLIHVGPDYAFEIGKTDITLFERKVSDKGRVYFANPLYFSSLEAMYNRLADTGLAGLQSLQDIAERQIELKNWVRETIKNAVLALSERADKEKTSFSIPTMGKKNNGLKTL